MIKVQKKSFGTQYAHILSVFVARSSFLKRSAFFKIRLSDEQITTPVIQMYNNVPTRLSPQWLMATPELGHLYTLCINDNSDCVPRKQEFTHYY